ncbi:MAG: TonB-dependent receptor [Nitrospira sp.]|nr:TonB-dependent receptor [Nitrospira sp.]
MFGLRAHIQSDRTFFLWSLSVPWHILIPLAGCWFLGLSHSWAQPSPPIPRASSAVEQQLQDESLYLKEETVSIASRYEQPISRAPSDVYVITDEDIRSSGATDVPTLLRRVPGMEVMQTNAVDFNVSVRGNNQISANKLLVQVDGRSIYVDQAGIVFWKQLPVALIEIKRIEVLKGPASAVYGFNAFDGVVNIITKSPEEMRGTTLQVAGGEIGTLLINAIHAGTSGKWGYRLSAGHEQTQRWSNHDAPAINGQRVSGIAEYRLSGNGKIRAEAGFARSNPYNGFLSSIDIGETHISQSYGLVSYEQNGLLVRGWWNGVLSETESLIHPQLVGLLGITDRFGQMKQDYSLNSYDLETRYQFKPSESLHLNIGANYRHITGLSNMFANHTADNRFGLYTQGNWRVWPSLELSAGLRYDLDTFIAPTLSPRGAIVYHLTSNHAVRLSSSLAYRPPTIFEVGLNALNPVTLPGVPPVATTILGSSNVNPEQIVSYEIGYQGWWWDHCLRTRVTGFYNHISDLIAFRNPTSNPLNPVSPINGGVADVYGGEFGAEFLLTSWLSGFANYAYQEIGQSSSGFSRRGFPHHKVNAGLRLNWNQVRGEILYHHVGAASYPLADAFTNLAPFFPAGTVLPAEEVRSYNLLNLRLGYLLWRQQSGDHVREAELAVSVFNALNDTHREHPLGDLLGTRVMGWLTVKL